MRLGDKRYSISLQQELCFQKNKLVISLLKRLQIGVDLLWCTQLTFLCLCFCELRPIFNCYCSEVLVAVMVASMIHVSNWEITRVVHKLSTHITQCAFCWLLPDISVGTVAQAWSQNSPHTFHLCQVSFGSKL